MYQGDYFINEYHFECKGEIGMVVLARTEETALNIIKILNDRYLDRLPYTPKRHKFVKHITTNIPPYELEQEQAECIKKWKR